MRETVARRMELSPAQQRVVELAGVYGLPAVACVVAVVAALRYLYTPPDIHPVWDDSFISLTFARNLAEHGKLSFDGESWSAGATSFLHVVLLATAIKLGFNPITAGAGVGLASHVLLTLAVYWLGWAVFRDKLSALIGALIIGTTHFAVLDAGGGLETPLFMALLAGTFAALLTFEEERGRILTGVLLALAVLTRPEGVLLLPACAVYLWMNRPEELRSRELARHMALRAAPAVVVLAATVLYNIAVTEGLGPGTATAKMHFFQEYDFYFSDKIRILGDQVGLFLGSMLSVVILAAIGGQRRETVLFALFVVPMLALYVWLLPGGLGHYFHRYQHPILPLLAVLAGGGAAILIRQALARGIVEKALVVGALLVFAIPAYRQYENWRMTYGGAVAYLSSIERMAVDLHAIVGPEQTLATHDIGVVGYYGRYQVLDLVGLVNPEVIEYNKDRTLRIYLEGTQPDYLLAFEDWDVFFLQLGTATKPQTYEEIARYADPAAPYVLYRIHYPLEGR